MVQFISSVSTVRVRARVTRVRVTRVRVTWIRVTRVRVIRVRVTRVRVTRVTVTRVRNLLSRWTVRISMSQSKPPSPHPFSPYYQYVPAGPNS